MIVAIVGSRNFPETSLINKFLDENLNHDYCKRIISGGAQGVDTIARKYAISRKIEFQEIKPDWKLFGRAAGPIRNKTIVELSEIIYAFWDGESKGTLHVISYAEALHKKCIVILPTKDSHHSLEASKRRCCTNASNL